MHFRLSARTLALGVEVNASLYYSRLFALLNFAVDLMAQQVAREKALTQSLFCQHVTSAVKRVDLQRFRRLTVRFLRLLVSASRAK